MTSVACTHVTSCSEITISDSTLTAGTKFGHTIAVSNTLKQQSLVAVSTYPDKISGSVQIYQGSTNSDGELSYGLINVLNGYAFSGIESMSMIDDTIIIGATTAPIGVVHLFKHVAGPKIAPPIVIKPELNAVNTKFGCSVLLYDAFNAFIGESNDGLIGSVSLAVADGPVGFTVLKKIQPDVGTLSVKNFGAKIKSSFDLSIVVISAPDTTASMKDIQSPKIPNVQPSGVVFIYDFHAIRAVFVDDDFNGSIVNTTTGAFTYKYILSPDDSNDGVKYTRYGYNVEVVNKQILVSAHVVGSNEGVVFVYKMVAASEEEGGEYKPTFTFTIRSIDTHGSKTSFGSSIGIFNNTNIAIGNPSEKRVTIYSSNGDIHMHVSSELTSFGETIAIEGKIMYVGSTAVNQSAGAVFAEYDFTNDYEGYYYDYDDDKDSKGNNPPISSTTNIFTKMPLPVSIASACLFTVAIFGAMWFYKNEGYNNIRQDEMSISKEISMMENGPASPTVAATVAMNAKERDDIEIRARSLSLSSLLANEQSTSEYKYTHQRTSTSTSIPSII